MMIMCQNFQTNSEKLPIYLPIYLFPVEKKRINILIMSSRLGK